MQKSPIQLDRILIDIAKEKALNPFNAEASKKDIDEAWARVGSNNNLSVHESRSIFKVLQKKYDQEKLKASSSWKLFSIMEQIHKKAEPKYAPPEEQNDVHMEDEEEEYEMLDVQEDEKGENASSGSEDEGSNKSLTSNGSPKTENVVQQKQTVNQRTQQNNNSFTSPPEEKKLLNSLVGNQKISGLSVSLPQTPTQTSAAAVALQKKGITMKKASGGPGSPMTLNRQAPNTFKNATPKSNMAIVDNSKTIQLSESMKRKLSDDLHNPVSSTSVMQFKKIHIGHAGTQTLNKNATQHQQNTQQIDTKLEPEDNDQKKMAENSTHGGINIITIPGNPQIELTNGSNEPSSSSLTNTNAQNGFSGTLDDINIKSEILFDEQNHSDRDRDPKESKSLNGVTKPGDIINFGNFDNSLPPTFFKNLCNSTRHEALGLYVANVMNRLSEKSADKLELKILQALVDIRTEEADNK